MKPKVKHNRLIYIVALIVFTVATWMSEASAEGGLETPSVGEIANELDLKERIFVEYVRQGKGDAAKIISVAAVSIAERNREIWEKNRASLSPHLPRIWAAYKGLVAGRLAHFARGLGLPATEECFRELAATAFQEFDASVTVAGYIPQIPDVGECGRQATGGKAPRLNGEPSSWPPWARAAEEYGVRMGAFSYGVADDAYYYKFRAQVEDLLDR